MGQFQQNSLYKPLLQHNIITEDQLDLAQVRAKSENITVIDAIQKLGFANISVIQDVLNKNENKTTNIEKINPDQIKISEEILKKIPSEFAIKNNVIPIKELDDHILLATSDLYDIVKLDLVSRFYDKKLIVPVFYSENEINKLISKFYKSNYSINFKAIIAELEANYESNNLSDFSSPIVRLVDSMLSEAVSRKVSDIHIEPEDGFIRVRFRLDGVLFNFTVLHIKHLNPLVVRIKILSGLNIAESRNPQDGAISMVINGNPVDFRVSTIPTIYGENIVIRVLDKTETVGSIDELGFSKHNLELIKLSLQKPEGIIIVTGPTGSGKTTTLYSLLSTINTVDRNIMTLEDPVEYKMKMIRQSEINHKAGFDFASGLRSILRQDPDIVFLGEIRDKETADIAIRAAITGHQVFSTLHTNNAISAVIRLIDIGIQSFMLSGSLVAVVSQRLVRKLCPKCKVQHKMPLEMKRIFNIKEDLDVPYFTHVGCEACYNSGYKGRVALSEILFINDAINLVISSNPTIKSITEVANEQGFVPIQKDGILKITQGISSISEVASVIDMTEYTRQLNKLDLKI
jgi:type IV pilus assembly protein PilB